MVPLFSSEKHPTAGTRRESPETPPMKNLLRGFLPVVVDIETGGLNEATDALLEIAVVFVGLDKQRLLHPKDGARWAVQPFPGANMEESSLQVNCIDPFDPTRGAQPEREVLKQLFSRTRAELGKTGCKRAILAGHNAAFDLKFLNAAAARNNIKDNPFHSFSSIDTVTLGALAYGQTVLSKIAEAADLEWNSDKAHSADYDAGVTAHILCNVFNRWRQFEWTQT